MSSLKHHIIALIALLGTAALSSSAAASLCGFNHYNSLSREERILNLQEVPLHIRNYRSDMRDVLLMLIRYAKEQKPDFKIVAHAGENLLTKSMWEYSRDGYNRARTAEGVSDDYFLFHDNYFDVEPLRDTAAWEYLNSLDAIAVNNLYCGENVHLSAITSAHNLGLISIEQCASAQDLEQAITSSIADKRSIYGFLDADEAFRTIGDYSLINDSAKNVYNVSDAQNILILNDDSLYSSQEQLADDLSKTNYDIIVIKPLFNYHQRFSQANLQKLHFKKNGSKRLLLAQFDVSEADPREYYWRQEWKTSLPDWAVRASFCNRFGIITRYWDNEWKKIISRYFKDVLNEGFDGVFFTGIENYRYFESQTPLE
ncbi:MAG: hypothetical protein IJ529_05300 [Alphaproteobacteria bacterium]|nr:hypothetical protein [Alphaproteobacteria bacterium]MBQ9235841.1 hypothetical protein [Alphaproteobacteria bacterium]